MNASPTTDAKPTAPAKTPAQAAKPKAPARSRTANNRTNNRANQKSTTPPKAPSTTTPAATPEDTAWRPVNTASDSTPTEPATTPVQPTDENDIFDETFKDYKVTTTNDTPTVPRPTVKDRMVATRDQAREVITKAVSNVRVAHTKIDTLDDIQEVKAFWKIKEEIGDLATQFNEGRDFTVDELIHVHDLVLLLGFVQTYVDKGLRLAIAHTELRYGESIAYTDKRVAEVDRKVENIETSKTPRWAWIIGVIVTIVLFIFLFINRIPTGLHWWQDVMIAVGIGAIIVGIGYTTTHRTRSTNRSPRKAETDTHPAVGSSVSPN